VRAEGVAETVQRDSKGNRIRIKRQTGLKKKKAVSRLWSSRGEKERPTKTQLNSMYSTRANLGSGKGERKGGIPVGVRKAFMCPETPQ